MRRLLIAALAGAVLAGCTTPANLLNGAPEISAVTKKDPKAFALCVYPSWQNYRTGSVMSETSEGYRIIAGNDFNGQTDDVLDIRKTPSGSSIRLYQRMAWQQMGRADLKESITRCQ